MKVDIAPFRPKTILKGFALIYGLSILSCWLINRVVLMVPIGPWEGDQIAANYWLDNVTWQIFAVWWACLFACCGFFPFHRIESRITRGIAVTIASWALGWLSGKLIYSIGPGADGIFPLVGTTWFLLALLCFAGGNWPVKTLGLSRQFLILLLIITGGTYLITHSSMGWVPAWWFPFLLVGLGTSTVTYLTRGMSPVSRAVAIILILFAAVSLCLSISASLGLWRMEAPSVSPFWKMGHFTDDQLWLLWFMGATSINYAFPVVTACWPFSRIPMPLGGLIACAFYLALTVVAAYVMRALIGPVFHDMKEALTYAYMGVNWSLVIPLVFGVGMEKPWLWVGQRTPGSWDDVGDDVDDVDGVPAEGEAAYARS